VELICDRIEKEVTHSSVVALLVIVNHTNFLLDRADTNEPPPSQLFELNEPPVPSPRVVLFLDHVDIFTAAAPGVVVAGNVVNPAGDAEDPLPAQIVPLIGVCENEFSEKNCDRIKMGNIR
jgi:hypothetical protein